MEVVQIEFQADTTSAVNDIERLENSLENTADEAQKTQRNLNKLDNETKKTSSSMKTLADDVTENGGAMAILDSLTGGLATTFKDSYEAIELSSKGLKGWRAAALATGIGALVIALGALIANWDSLSKDITGATSATRENLDVATAAVEVEKEKLELLNQQDNILKLQGLSEEEILLLKQEQTKETIKQLRIQLAEQKRAAAEAQGSALGIQALFESTNLGFLGDWLFGKPEEVAKERQTEISENESFLNKLLNQEAGYQIRLQELRKQRNEENNEEDNNQIVKRIQTIQKIDTLEMARVEINKDANRQIQINNQATLDNLDDAYQESVDRRNELEKQAQEQKEMIVMQGFQSLIALNNAFAGQTEQGQKRSFRVNKALAISESIVSTYLSATKAYASQLSIPTPDAPVRASLAAAAAVAAGLANIAVISQQKFEPNSAGGGGFAGGNGSGAVGSFSQFQGANTPVISAIPNFNPNQQPPIGGNNNGIRAYVVENDITSSQSRQKILERKSRL